MQPEPSTPAWPEILDPEVYAREGYPDAAFRRLRHESPVHWFGDAPTPFWAITRHADIVRISRRPDLFSNRPQFQILVDAPFGGDDEREPDTLIQMDPPEHRRYRELLSRRFTPAALRPVEAALDPIADSVLSELEEERATGECDFVDRIAARFPMAVISWLLDVPEGDRELLYEWSNAVVTPNDPRHRRVGEDAHEVRLRATASLGEYLGSLAERRRPEEGRGDLLSELGRATVDGRPLPPRRLASYAMLLIVAGNETTRNAFSGGVRALIERPAQWDALCARPSPRRIADTTEEFLRWTTPVVQMARTATRDTDLHGRRIRAGDTLALFYASANRDERVFPDPFAFRPERQPNPHLSFGIGEHFCMGAWLARIEIRSMLRRLVARMEHLELAGAPTYLRSSAASGLETLPVRYAFKRS